MSVLTDKPVVDSASSSTGEQVRGRKRLSRPAWHFIVDVILLCGALSLAWASAMIRFVFPPPTQADGWTLWGLTYDHWADVQFGALCWLLMTAVVHLMLQWDWVCNFVVTRLSKARGGKIVVPKAARTLYGVGTLIVVLTLFGLLLAVADFMVVPPP